MASPRVNVDVLTVACECLTDVSDVLSLSLTCSSVRLIAVKWLIRMRPVYLKSGLSIRSFHLFFFADPAERASHLRALHIDLSRAWPGQPQVDVDDYSLLVKILASCQHLQHLTITLQTASLPTIDNFFHATTTLSSLHSFSIRGVSIDALKFLPQFHTPLRALGIHSENIPVGSRYPTVLEEFIPRIIVQTLEELQLDKLEFDPHDILIQVPGNSLMPSVLDVMPYSAVRSLSVASFRGKPLLDRLQYLFPALDSTLHFGGLDMWSVQDSYADLRAANQRSQDGPCSGAWKKLDQVVCGPAALYVLGLRCPIRLAIIHIHRGSVDQYHYAAEALRENPVPRLQLMLYHGPGMLDRLFSPEQAERLTHFMLCLSYGDNYESSPQGQRDADVEDTPQVQWDDVLSNLISGLQPLHKLTHLRIIIGANIYVHKDAPSPFRPREGRYAHPFRPSMSDFEETATALARILPSLQNLFLTTSGFLSSWAARSTDGGRDWQPYESYINHGWRIAALGTDGLPDGERSVVELHEEVTNTIIRKEELVLSERDEAALHLNYGWHTSPPTLLM
ncbi:hypothetical protein LXA43DRAFT_1099167 [Ganoderma leucocontextum]|nr:hypothetical protein LXA43DRAFT_1099167 [Ganoderma leucocontextum]